MEAGEQQQQPNPSQPPNLMSLQTGFPGPQRLVPPSEEDGSPTSDGGRGAYGMTAPPGTVNPAVMMSGPPGTQPIPDPNEPLNLDDANTEIWVETKAGDGKSYYYNAKSRDTTWTRPEGENIKIISQEQVRDPGLGERRLVLLRGS